VNGVDNLFCSIRTVKHKIAGSLSLLLFCLIHQTRLYTSYIGNTVKMKTYNVYACSVANHCSFINLEHWFSVT